MKKLLLLLILSFASVTYSQTQRSLVGIGNCSGTDKISGISSDGTYNCTADVGGGGLPAGAIILIASGTCPVGFSEVAGLVGKTLIGTNAASGDVGTTGGNDNITPSGTNSTPTFTGNALAGHVHTFTGSLMSTHLHGVGTYAADAHAGTAVADHASHTHTYTQVVNHVHLETAPTGQTGAQDSFTRDTSTTGSSNTALSTANPTGGVATGTTAGPSAILTHSVTQPSNHSLSGSSEAISAGTPAGTLDSISGGTPSGSVSTPTFTGNAFDNRSAFMRVIFCSKT